MRHRMLMFSVLVLTSLACNKPDPAVPVENPGAGGRNQRDTDWIEFKSKEDDFVAIFPKTPERTSQDNQYAFGKVTINSFISRSKPGVLWQVAMHNYPQAFIRSMKPGELITVMRDGMAKNAKVKAEAIREVTLNGHSGQEFMLRVTDQDPRLSINSKMRLYLVGNRVYQVAVTGPASDDSLKDDNKFFESFKLLAAETAAAPFKQEPDAPKPGPAVQNPELIAEAKLFSSPAKSAVPTGYLKISSDRGDFVGQGKSYNYVGDKFRVKLDKRGLEVHVDKWILFVGAPAGQSLIPGEYPDAKTFPSRSHSPGLTFVGNGRANNTVVGEFVIWELEENNGQVSRLAVDFVQRGDGKSAALKGKLRFNSSFE